MNVFIRDEYSRNYYNLFDVSTINISLCELSEKEYAIDIHVFNDTFHVYARSLPEKGYEGEKYRDLERKIKVDDFISIICDSVHAVPVSR